MKKLVLTIAIILSSFSLMNANNQINNSKMNEDSFPCRLHAYNEAQASGYAYGSQEWQWVYYSEKHMCDNY